MLALVKDFQTLATGMLAILAAGIGFGGVWYAQRSIARNAKEDREHREKIAKEDREHRETAANRQAAAEREHRRTVFIHAITGELSATQPLIHNASNWARVVGLLYKKIGELSNGQKSGGFIPKSQFQTSVYDQHIGDIGLLPPSLTYALVSVYTRLKAKVSDPENPNKPISLTGLPAEAVAITADALREYYNDLAQDTYDLVMRLHSVRLGHGDPGKGKDFQYYAQKFNLESTDKIAQDDLKSGGRAD